MGKGGRTEVSVLDEIVFELPEVASQPGTVVHVLLEGDDYEGWPEVLGVFDDAHLAEAEAYVELHTYDQIDKKGRILQAEARGLSIWTLQVTNEIEPFLLEPPLFEASVTVGYERHLSVKRVFREPESTNTRFTETTGGMSASGKRFDNVIHGVAYGATAQEAAAKLRAALATRGV